MRCVAQAKRAGTDPVGTAGYYAAFVLVEVPLPWPADILGHPVLTDLRAVLQASAVPVRVQGLVPEHGERSGRGRLVVYRRPEGAFSRFIRYEDVVAHSDFAARCAALLGGSEEPSAEDVLDVLICTHGSRDRCCGSLGASLFMTMNRPQSGVRLWRTSHTGGHRFAPTAIVLPYGQVWAWLDAELLTTVMARAGDPRDLVAHYRGCAGIAEPAVQAAESAAFAEIGWEWLDHSREAEILERSDDGARIVIRIDHRAPDGGRGSFDAVVERVGFIAQPVCGQPLPVDGKSDPQFRVVELASAG